MEDTLAVIERVIKEHKTLTGKLHDLERGANDADTIAELEKARDTFMPGRLGKQQESLLKLKELLEITERGLDAHFNYEETELLSVIEKHGDRRIVSALHSLLLEHKDIRDRFAHSKNHLEELASQGKSRFVWEASAHDMRAHISHTRKLIEAHAAIEQELLQELKTALTREKKR